MLFRSRPLTTETLRKILEESQFANDPEFAEILEQALRKGRPLLKDDAYVAEGEYGYTLSDEQFRRYLLDSERSEERRVGKECRSRWSPDH